MKTITLLKPHTHAGKALQPDAVLSINDRDAEWLVKEGVARLGGTLPPSPAAPTTTDK